MNSFHVYFPVSSDEFQLKPLSQMHNLCPIWSLVDGLLRPKRDRNPVCLITSGKGYNALGIWQGGQSVCQTPYQAPVRCSNLQVVLGVACTQLQDLTSFPSEGTRIMVFTVGSLDTRALRANTMHTI